MIKIAHRGNVNGSILHLENSPNYIYDAISKGYDVEVDVRMSINNTFWLGHNIPSYKIDFKFLEDIKDRVWIHCKNLEMLYFLNNYQPDFKYFWHEEDMFTLTSNGYIWTYPNNRTTDRSILVDLNLDKYSPDMNVYGVCSDIVGDI